MSDTNEEQEENSDNSKSLQNEKNLIENNTKNNSQNQEKNKDYTSKTNSFIESDIDEFKNIFNQSELKNQNEMNTKSYESSKLFEGSEDNNLKNEEISLKDLDPRIKEVLILFVLSNDYYQLLVQERAKKAFKFKVKK